MSEVVLEMKNVTKRFPGVIALKEVSIAVEKGEVMAICGENGAGKSTLMKVLSGSYSHKEYEGEIWINGKREEFSCISDAERCGIEMVYQELNMILVSSVAENLYVGNLPGNGAFVDWKKLYADTRKILESVDMGHIDPKTPAGESMRMRLQRRYLEKAKATEAEPEECCAPSMASDARLDDMLSQVDESFAQMLIRKIDERHMTDAQCYKRANVDRRLFNKIKNIPDYKPSKQTALAFAIALELSLDETKDMLMKAGFALSHSSKADIVVEYCIMTGNYDIMEINQILFGLDLQPLGY